MNHRLRQLKHGLKWLLAPLSVGIADGPLKGYRWSISTGSRFVSGTYESFKTDAYLEVLRPGDVVVDVGAHVGYYAAVASKLVGEQGKVLAFEPRPLNLRFLRQHVRANRLHNVQIVEAGVGEHAGESGFDTRSGTGTGKLSSSGDLTVRTVRLDDLYRAGDLPRIDFLKIDVEGGEMGVLKGGADLIRASMPIILVATHDESLHRDVVRFLDGLGYRHRVLDAGGASGDTEVLAMPPGRSDDSATMHTNDQPLER